MNRSRLKWILILILFLLLGLPLALKAENYLYWRNKLKKLNFRILIVRPASDSNTLSVFSSSNFTEKTIYSSEGNKEKRHFMPFGVRINDGGSKVAVHVTGDISKLIVFETTSWEKIFEFTGDTSGRLRYSWSPNGQYLAYSIGLNETGYKVSNQTLSIISFDENNNYEEIKKLNVLRKQTIDEPFESFGWSNDSKKVFFRDGEKYKYFAVKEDKEYSIEKDSLEDELWITKRRGQEIIAKPGQKVNIKSPPCSIPFCKDILVIDNQEVLGNKIWEHYLIERIEWFPSFDLYLVESVSKLNLLDNKERSYKFGEAGFIAFID